VWWWLVSIETSTGHRSESFKESQGLSDSAQKNAVFHSYWEIFVLNEAGVGMMSAPSVGVFGYACYAAAISGAVFLGTS
jgi:hypothetical protein